MSGSAFAVTHHAFSSGAGRTSDGNGSHASTLKSPSYTKSVSWQHYHANEAINHGFALVTEERRSTGIYAYLDIGFNSLISNIRNYKNKVGLLDNSRMKSDTQWVIDSMRVKTPGHRTQIGSLSG
ncbi:galactose binding protein [Shigella boydii]|nr:galactose binding protein [Shigella boydii]